jgi:biopolymer transport protein ExbD
MAGGAGGMDGGDDDEGGDIADINVTPLVDVVLVLLIIMMVAAPLLANNQSIKVDLPKAVSGEPTQKSTIALTLRKDGALYYGTESVSEAEARKRIKAEHRKNEKVQAVIDADKGVAYGRVVRLLDMVKSEGITAFALNIDSTP